MLRTIALVGYMITVILASAELWQLRGLLTPEARRHRRRAVGGILLMSAIPIAVFQGRLTTLQVAVLVLLLVGPGLWLYWSAQIRTQR
jgi:uncharacterized membrane protein